MVFFVEQELTPVSQQTEGSVVSAAPDQIFGSAAKGPELAEALSETIASIHQRGWCDGTGGNFSCVIQTEPLTLMMAPSGVNKGRVKTGDLIEVNAAAEVISGSGRASAETQLHLAIVEETGAGAVLHTHSQAGTLLSHHYKPGHGLTGHLMLKDMEMLKGLQGVVTHATSIAVPVFANDQNIHRLSATVREHLKEAPHGLLVSGHGLYAWGKNLGQAERHLEIHEFLLEQHWRQLLLKSLNQDPEHQTKA